MDSMSTIVASIDTPITTYSSNKKGEKKSIHGHSRPPTPVIIIEDFEETAHCYSTESSRRNSITNYESDAAYNFGFGQTSPHLLKVPSKTTPNQHVSLYDFNDCISTLTILNKL
uniref:Uncharacterized protein n=1 Tax=Parastrongyloides trichosuri TaxID=131310 RepID=A0A0N4ZEG1_PARTI